MYAWDKYKQVNERWREGLGLHSRQRVVVIWFTVFGVLYALLSCFFYTRWCFQDLNLWICDISVTWQQLYCCVKAPLRQWRYKITTTLLAESFTNQFSLKTCLILINLIFECIFCFSGLQMKNYFIKSKWENIEQP